MIYNNKDFKRETKDTKGVFTLIENKPTLPCYKINRQTAVYKTQPIKLMTEQQESHQKTILSHVLQQGKQIFTCNTRRLAFVRRTPGDKSTSVGYIRL